MNKLLAIAALTLLSVGLYHHGVSQTVDVTSKFESYSSRYGKNYTPAERAYRQAIYEENMRKIEAHNQDVTQTYKMGENQFTDFTQEEFASLYLTLKSGTSDLEEFVPTNVAAPEVDWSTLTKVKDQGNCGSCWAFSAVGAIESVFRVEKAASTPELSEQQLVDCDTNSEGCNGGWEDKAITWAATYGLTTASAYPYKGKDQTCKITGGAYKPKSVKAIAAANIQKAITNYPVSVAVDATNWSAYSSGIFSNCKKSLNHAVLAVGYYADGTWVIKNSWGTSWGEKGFIRLKAGDTCGVTQDACIAQL